MYLSKVVPSVYHLHELKRKFSGGLFWEHQMIWNLFHNTPEQNRDFLYRREGAPGKLPFYYILSAREPAITAHDFSIDTKLFKPIFQIGDHLQFSLRANAVVTRKVDGNSKKRRRRDIIEAKVDEYKKLILHPSDRPSPSLIHLEAVQEWLKKQGENYGFSIGEILVENHLFQKVKKPGDSNIRRFTSIDIHGQIRVNEPMNLISAITSGLGRSKAFGCGLLLVRRV